MTGVPKVPRLLAMATSRIVVDLGPTRRRAFAPRAVVAAWTPMP